MIPKVKTCYDPAEKQFEKIDTVDLEVLDTTSLTSVSDFILAYQADKTFAPPESSSMVYDSDIAPINIDDDAAPEFCQDFDELLNDARAQS